jgi:2-hydroxy-6-oxonona-2,4-dienedioate hydrolase
MPIATFADAFIGYDMLGDSGPLAVLTPGGRYSAQSGRALAELLSNECRVVVFDRRNAGRSSAWFGARSEADMEADDIVGLARELGADGVHIVGGGGGARTALLAARRYPDYVRGISLWWIIGGEFGLATMAARYTQSLIGAARRGGMEEVIRLPELADVMANPANQRYARGLDAGAFIDNMMSWVSGWMPRPDRLTSGMSIQDLHEIRVPTLIFDQFDDYHPTEIAHGVHAAVPGSRLVQPPTEMGPDTFWARQARGATDPTSDPLADWVHLAPPILQFIFECEPAPTRPSGADRAAADLDNVDL